MKEFIKNVYRELRLWTLSQNLHHYDDFLLSPEEKEASSKISIIVAVHNAPDVTHRCLVSLQKFSGNAEVIIVDDASSLKDLKHTLQDFCRRNNWSLTTNVQALGHSRASETGVSLSTRPYVCLLNSDAIITSRSWAGIVQTFEPSSNICIAGPSTSYTVGPQVVSRAWHCRHYWSNEQIWCFAEKYVARQKGKPLVDVPFVGGFAFFVRRSVWDSLGGFDKNLPDYGNEMEFCKRAIHSGFRIAWARNSYIHHLGNESYGKTIGLNDIKKRSLQALLYTQKKHKE